VLRGGVKRNSSNSRSCSAQGGGACGSRHLNARCFRILHAFVLRLCLNVCVVPAREWLPTTGSTELHCITTLLLVALVLLLQVPDSPPPPPPYPPPPPPPSPVAAAEDTAAADAAQMGRKGGFWLGMDSSSTFQMTPGKAVVLWLALVGVFLMLLPRIFRQKRARSGQRSD